MLMHVAYDLYVFQGCKIKSFLPIRQIATEFQYIVNGTTWFQYPGNPYIYCNWDESGSLI